MYSPYSLLGDHCEEKRQTRETSQAVERQPGQILEGQDLNMLCSGGTIVIVPHEISLLLTAFKPILFLIFTLGLHLYISHDKYAFKYISLTNQVLSYTTVGLYLLLTG